MSAPANHRAPFTPAQDLTAQIAAEASRLHGMIDGMRRVTFHPLSGERPAKVKTIREPNLPSSPQERP